MRTIPSTYRLLALGTLLFFACKPEKPVHTPCEAVYRNTLKIRSISCIRADSSEAARYQFYYNRSLLDSIAVTSAATQTREQYKLFYDSCVLTGYRIETRYEALSETWITDGRLIRLNSSRVDREENSRRVLPDGGRQFSLKFEHQLNASGKPAERLNRCLFSGCPAEGRFNRYRYSSRLNADSISIHDDAFVCYTSAISYDQRKSPHSMQGHVLYHLPLQYFNKLFPVANRFMDLFDMFALSGNNPLKFTVYEREEGNKQYTFLYAYHGGGGPVSIKVMEAVPKDPFHNPDLFGPAKLVGELKIAYY